MTETKACLQMPQKLCVWVVFEQCPIFLKSHKELILCLKCRGISINLTIYSACATFWDYPQYIGNFK